jgi:hypothetical protein
MCSGLGNNKTYRGSKGQHNLPPSCLEIELSSDHEMDSALPLPPQPTHDPNSPFNATAHTPFLGYPADKRLPHPHASDPDPMSPTPGRLNSVPPGGIPTDSQSLSSLVPTPVPGHTHLPLVAVQSLLPSQHNPRKCRKLYQNPRINSNFPRFFPKPICAGFRSRDPGAYPCRVAALVKHQDSGVSPIYIDPSLPFHAGLLSSTFLLNGTLLWSDIRYRTMYFLVPRSIVFTCR